MLSGKLTYVLAFLLPFVQLGSNHLREQLLCLDERNLNVSVWVAVERELTGNTLRKSSECLGILLREVSQNVLTLSILVQILIVSTMSSQEVVQFLDKTTDSRDKFYQSFRNQHNTEVVTVSSTVGYYLSDILYNLVQCHILGLYLL